MISTYFEFLKFIIETAKKWMSPNNPKYLVGKIIKINKPGYTERYFSSIGDRIFPRIGNVNNLLKYTGVKIISDEILILDIIEYHGKLGKEFYYKTLSPFGISQIIWYDLYDMDIFNQFHIRDFVDVID